MCGIVMALDRTGAPVNELVWEQYEKQKTRGQQGFGVFNGQYTVKAAMEKRIKRWMAKEKNGSNMLMFHHRFPTSTINVKRAAHPFNTGEFFGKNRYVLVHNGVIRDPKDLKEAHEKLGIKYQSTLDDGTFNDSEALLWDMALTLEGKQDNMKAYGGIAFICIKMVSGKPDKMFFGRNFGRPLKLNRTKTSIMLSSEGEGEEIEENQMYTYNYGKNRLTKKYFRIPSYDPKYYDYNLNTKYPPAQTTTKLIGSSTPSQPWGYRGGSQSSFDDFYDSRYGNMFDDPQPDKPEVWSDIAQDWIPNPNYKGVSTPQKLGDLIGFEDDDDLSPLMATVQEINATYFRFLALAKGNFADAYWKLIEETKRLEDDMTTGVTNEEMRRYDACLEAEKLYLQDPQYIDINSIHPMWQKAGSASENSKLIGATA
jgi:predicted glutamine amidotransferase